MNPYEELGIERTANAGQIKKAYRQACVLHHPDKGGDPEKFRAAQLAYDVLTDPERRQRYDETGDYGQGSNERTAAIEARIASELLSIVRITFQTGMEICPSMALETLKRQFQAEQGVARESEKKGIQMAGKLRESAGKILRKGAGRNVFQEVYEAQAQEIARQVGQARAHQLFLSALLEYLEEYKGDAPEAQMARFVRSGNLAQRRRSFVSNLFEDEV